MEKIRQEPHRWTPSAYAAALYGDQAVPFQVVTALPSFVGSLSPAHGINKVAVTE
jgi:hypothetical protein